VAQLFFCEKDEIHSMGMAGLREKPGNDTACFSMVQVSASLPSQRIHPLADRLSVVLCCNTSEVTVLQ